MILCSLAWHVKSDEKRTDLLTGEAGQSGCDANSCASYRGQRWMLLADFERPDSRFLISSEDRFTRGGLPFVSVSPSTIPAGIRNISRVDSLRAHPAIGRIQCKKTLRRASAQRCLHRGVRPPSRCGPDSISRSSLALFVYPSDLGPIKVSRVLPPLPTRHAKCARQVHPATCESRRIPTPWEPAVV